MQRTRFWLATVSQFGGSISQVISLIIHKRWIKAQQFVLLEFLCPSAWNDLLFWAASWPVLGEEEKTNQLP